MRRNFTSIYTQTNDLSRALVGNVPEGEFLNSPRRGAPAGAPIPKPYTAERIKERNSTLSPIQAPKEPDKAQGPLKRPPGLPKPKAPRPKAPRPQAPKPKERKPRKSRAKGPVEPGKRYSFKSPSRVHKLNSDPKIIFRREMTQRRRREETKSRQDNEFYKEKLRVVATGGKWTKPTDHYPRGRRYSAETVESLKYAGRRLGAASVALKEARAMPATTGLNGLGDTKRRKGQEDLYLRSPGEELSFCFDLRHLELFNDRTPENEELSYPEIDNPKSCNDVSCNIYGHLTHFTRDLDHTLCGTKYQTQVKGTDFLVKRLEQSLKPVSINSPTEFQYRFRKFELLHKTLTDFVIRDLTNFLSSCVEPGRIRRILYRSFRSAAYWDKINLTALNEEALLRLYKRESRRMARHWEQILATIFPESSELIKEAESLFVRFYKSDAGQRLEWTAEKVSSQLLEYIAQAKLDLDYDDSPKAFFRHWLKWRKQVKYWSSGKYADRLNFESISGLPQRFKPTTTAGLYRANELYMSNEKRRYKKRKMHKNNH
jgi:hypothetical protein